MARSRFERKVVWVTGASSGVGRALARAFHAEGARVILSARREDALREAAAECAGGGEAFVLPLDLEVGSELPGKVDAALARFGRIDILVNNAGISQRALVADAGMEVYRRLFEVDVFGPWALSKLVLPHMLTRRSGHIVVTSSISARYSTPLRSGYNGAKRALEGMFESLRAEVWAQGIAVTLLVLGAVDTEISVHALRGDGTPYGRRNRVLAEGFTPDKAARRSLDAIAARRDEVMIARLAHRWLVWRRRYFPGLAARAVRLRQPPKHPGLDGGGAAERY
jgi:NAD(P)-dependent dehydrogenase (short-subunit alcohol dehydrogenase family)